jgi:hypothetical protein
LVVNRKSAVRSTQHAAQAQAQHEPLWPRVARRRFFGHSHSGAGSSSHAHTEDRGPRGTTCYYGPGRKPRTKNQEPSGPRPRPRQGWQAWQGHWGWFSPDSDADHGEGGDARSDAKCGGLVAGGWWRKSIYAIDIRQIWSQARGQHLRNDGARAPPLGVDRSVRIAPAPVFLRHPGSGVAASASAPRPSAFSPQRQFSPGRYWAGEAVARVHSHLVHCPRAATTFPFPLFRLLRPLVALLFLDVVKNFLLSSS